MIAASVQCDVDGIAKGSHYSTLTGQIDPDNYSKARKCCVIGCLHFSPEDERVLMPEGFVDRYHGDEPTFAGASGPAFAAARGGCSFEVRPRRPHVQINRIEKMEGIKAMTAVSRKLVKMIWGWTHSKDRFDAARVFTCRAAYAKAA